MKSTYLNKLSAIRYRLHAALIALFCIMLPQMALAQELTELTNYRSGISVKVAGTNGIDYAYERYYHDPLIDDRGILYILSRSQISLGHNERNSFSIQDRYFPRIGIGLCSDVTFPSRYPGAAGPDGIENSGDEGTIAYAIDRDARNTWRVYTGSGAPRYSGVFNFSAYNDYITDSYGDRYAVLTYWDIDDQIIAPVPNGKTALSDGSQMLLVVDPLTPILQFSAEKDSYGRWLGEYYTTPAKTYHIERIFEQTTYLSGQVYIQLRALNGSGQTIYYGVDQSVPSRVYTGPILSSEMFTLVDHVYTLSYKVGDGPVKQRRIHYRPARPGAGEKKGLLLFGDQSARNDIFTKIGASGTIYNDRYKKIGITPSLDINAVARGYWRAETGIGGAALNEAFFAAIESQGFIGSARSFTWGDAARSAALRLLKFYRVDPVGQERALSDTTPSPDIMCLGQEQVDYRATAVAYDLLRIIPEGKAMSAIEEIKIRDNLACYAKLTLQFHDHNSYSCGPGGSHWPWGQVIATAFIAMTMPQYDSIYYGTSGAGGMVTAGHFDAPYPDIAISWMDMVDKLDLANINEPQALTVEDVISEIRRLGGADQAAGIGSHDLIKPFMALPNPVYPDRQFILYGRPNLRVLTPFNSHLDPEDIIWRGPNGYWRGYVVLRTIESFGESAITFETFDKDNLNIFKIVSGEEQAVPISLKEVVNVERGGYYTGVQVPQVVKDAYPAGSFIEGWSRDLVTSSAKFIMRQKVFDYKGNERMDINGYPLKGKVVAESEGILREHYQDHWGHVENSGYESPFEIPSAELMNVRARFDAGHYPLLDAYMERKIRKNRMSSSTTTPIYLSSGYFDFGLKAAQSVRYKVSQGHGDGVYFLCFYDDLHWQDAPNTNPYFENGSSLLEYDAKEGELLNFALKALDNEHDPIWFTSDGQKYGVSCYNRQDNTAWFSFLPDMGSSGSFTFKVVVRDDRGGWASRDIKVNVLSAGQPRLTHYADDFEDGDFWAADLSKFTQGIFPLSWQQLNKANYQVTTDASHLVTSLSVKTFTNPDLLITNAGADWADYSVNLTLTNRYSYAQQGIIVRYLDPDNYYFVSLGRSGQGGLYRVLNGEEEKLAAVSALDPGHMERHVYRIEVRTTGEGVSIRADKNNDGSYELSHTDSDPVALSKLMRGRLGIRYDGADAWNAPYWDDFDVEVGRFEIVTEHNFMYGDVSGDGEVGAYDAALTTQAAVGSTTLTAEQTQKADVSGDGSVGAYDAALIAQRVVGLIDRFPVE